ncbi:MAG: Fic family protein [Clostridiales bacterium]|nr:Fic family protein [Clostridiales bacterium]
MKIFDLEKQVTNMLSPDAMSFISLIEERKGFTASIPKRKKLNRLHDLSKRRSVTSSNKIEGISVTKAREEELLLNGVDAKTKEDYALLGYNNALTYVIDNYKYLPLSESLIKDLHYKMYEAYAPAFGGKYKEVQNYINAYDAKGNYKETLFIPSAPEEVASQLGNLIWQFNNCANNPMINKLLLVFTFILDFICIHPFSDGNGRVSRLLTTMLLLKFGYTMDEYYSLSYLILEHQDEYYEALHLSDRGWHENKNDPYPFVRFHLARLVEGYNKIAYIIAVFEFKGTCKEKVLRVIKDHMVPTSKAYIEEILFEYTRSTIEKALDLLLESKEIQFVAKGQSATYVVS